MREVTGPRPTRALVPVLVFVAQCCALLGCAYLLLGRGQLPGFFPHAVGAGVRDDARDLPMAFVAFCGAGFASYGAYYAKTHRSWLRSRRWHRKHGRI